MSCGLLLTDRDRRGLQHRRGAALAPLAETDDDVAPQANTPASADPSGPVTPRERRPGAGTVLTLVNGVLAGVGGVYVSTRSVLVTVIAAAAAMVLAIMLMIARR